MTNGWTQRQLLTFFIKKRIPIRENNMQRGTDLQKIGDDRKGKKNKMKKKYDANPT